MADTQELGLEVWRRTKGLTYKQLGEMLGISGAHAWLVCRDGVKSVHQVRVLLATGELDANDLWLP